MPNKIINPFLETLSGNPSRFLFKEPLSREPLLFPGFPFQEPLWRVPFPRNLFHNPFPGNFPGVQHSLCRGPFPRSHSRSPKEVRKKFTGVSIAPKNERSLSISWKLRVSWIPSWVYCETATNSTKATDEKVCELPNCLTILLIFLTMHARNTTYSPCMPAELERCTIFLRCMPAASRAGTSSWFTCKCTWQLSERQHALIGPKIRQNMKSQFFASNPTQSDKLSTRTRDLRSSTKSIRRHNLGVLRWSQKLVMLHQIIL